MSRTFGWHLPETHMSDVASMWIPNSVGSKIEPIRCSASKYAKLDPPTAAVTKRDNAGKRGQEAGGGMLTSSAEFFKFALTLARLGVAPNGHRILKAETVKLLHKNHLPSGMTLSDPVFNTHLTDELAGTDLATFCCPGMGYSLGCGVVVDKEEVAKNTTTGLGPCSVGTFGWLVFVSDHQIDCLTVAD